MARSGAAAEPLPAGGQPALAARAAVQGGPAATAPEPQASGQGAFAGPLVRLLFLVGVVGAPVQVLPAFCDVCGYPGRACSWLGVGLFLVLLALLGLRSRDLARRRAPLVPYVIAVAAVAIASWSWAYPEPWARWERRLRRSVDSCGAERTVQARSACVADVLARVTPPPAVHARPAHLAEAARDLDIGLVVMRNETLARDFRTWFGVDENFLGLGISVPASASHYSAGRAPEYLVPNHRERARAACLWTWRLAPKAPYLKETVRALITHVPPEHVNSGCVIDDVLAPRGRDGLPPVIRFGQVTDAKHGAAETACIGRPEARRVFASDLASVIDQTLGAAAESSGYGSPGDDVGEANLFVWVLAPSSSREVVPATWSRLFQEAPGWILAKGDCAP